MNRGRAVRRVGLTPLRLSPLRRRPMGPYLLVRSSASDDTDGADNASVIVGRLM